MPPLMPVCPGLRHVYRDIGRFNMEKMEDGAVTTLRRPHHAIKAKRARNLSGDCDIELSLSL